MKLRHLTNISCSEEEQYWLLGSYWQPIPKKHKKQGQLHTVNMLVVFVGLVIFKCFCHSWNLNKFLLNAAHALVLLLVSNRHL